MSRYSWSFYVTCETVFKILVWSKKNINEKGLGIADDGNDLNELIMINLPT